MSGSISYSGAFNASVLSSPGVYLNVLAPPVGTIAPAAFGLLGIVGVASWGPVNVPTVIGSEIEAAYFGSPAVRTHDLPTAMAVTLQAQESAGLGAQIIANRVTDGTDTSANYVFSDTTGAPAIILASKYTGTLGNSIVGTLTTGSRVGTWRLSLTLPGVSSETYDNITGSGQAFWQALSDAVNLGVGSLLGASRLIIATALTNAVNVTPSQMQFTLSGGTDGASGVTSSDLVGTDAQPRTGIYTFRNFGLSDAVIADFCDTTQEPNLTAFAMSEGVYVHTSGPAGETVSTAADAKAASGTDTPWLKRYLGDWTFWQDNTNQQQRSLAPATFGAAIISTLQPQLSGLNKAVIGVQATQRSKTLGPYGSDEIDMAVRAGLEIICNPIPAGNVFGLRTGQNASSNSALNGDNYPRLTSFLARSLTGPGALGTMIGQPITDDFFTDGAAMLDNFLAGLQRSGTIEGYSVTFNRSNNPPAQTATGLVVAQVLVRYLGIARILLVNLTSGQTVVLPGTNTTT